MKILMTFAILPDDISVEGCNCVALLKHNDESRELSIPAISTQCEEYEITDVVLHKVQQTLANFKVNNG